MFENDEVLAFRDINQAAPTHILVIPKKHIPTLNDLSDDDIMISLLSAVKQIVKQEKVDTTGYRLVCNCNKQGGQEVYHLHFHILASRQMQWPPG